MRRLLKSNMARIFLLAYLMHRVCLLQCNINFVNGSRSRNCQYQGGGESEGAGGR